jgi:hypothetical protein
MAKTFNVNGACIPGRHYMVNLKPRLEEIKAMVDAGAYFTINKARQYGKTTTLRALADFLEKDYEIACLDFQRISSLSFEKEQHFVEAFAEELLDCVKGFPEGVEQRLSAFADGTARINSLQALFKAIRLWCGQSTKPIVLMIDEVDTAADNQVFLDFLAQLRAAYLDKYTVPAFQSVILSGVYDVRNIREKLRPKEEYKTNSPWNIAADFLVEMSFSPEDIAGMLAEYEEDYHTGMDIPQMAQFLYASTSGYPYLVSRLCLFMDERLPGSGEFPVVSSREAGRIQHLSGSVEFSAASTRGADGGQRLSDSVKFPDRAAAWTKEGFMEAERMLVKENNPLYQSLIGKLVLYPELKAVLYELLFNGKPIPYVATNRSIEIAAMFGFVKNMGDTAVISNRIFETVLYNYFLSEEFNGSKIYDAGVRERNQFIVGGHLDVRRVLEKFVEAFDYLYGDREETFLEDAGRRYFMLFLKPIINGAGNCSVEPETRNRERMDLVIYYHGEQSIIEMKVWRGNAYNERGERQLMDYLEYFHLKKGYMLSFNFNKKKVIGVKDVILGDKVLVEAVV